ncbi:hypothetical protein [Corynebacterium sp.]|uniref:hypothetical protein n=1 Tax=Corynebacterium sp. TaxID=1720 RepID=UPI002A91054D|nr:hypothetical protein [Corynebacterium sp.]MDY5784615.1 hypothetical protein [Corynebacterium sp.]
MQSVSKAGDLLKALAEDTVQCLSTDKDTDPIIDPVKRDKHARVFIVRNKAVLEFFRKAVNNNNQDPKADYLRDLLKAGLVFTFSSPQSRDVSANNLRLVEPSVLTKEGEIIENAFKSEGEKVEGKTKYIGKGKKLNQLDWETYSFIEHPFKV